MSTCKLMRLRNFDKRTTQAGLTGCLVHLSWKTQDGIPVGTFHHRNHLYFGPLFSLINFALYLLNSAPSRGEITVWQENQSGAGWETRTVSEIIHQWSSLIAHLTKMNTGPRSLLVLSYYLRHTNQPPPRLFYLQRWEPNPGYATQYVVNEEGAGVHYLPACQFLIPALLPLSFLTKWKYLISMK